MNFYDNYIAAELSLLIALFVCVGDQGMSLETNKRERICKYLHNLQMHLVSQLYVGRYEAEHWGIINSQIGG